MRRRITRRVRPAVLPALVALAATLVLASCGGAADDSVGATAGRAPGAVRTVAIAASGPVAPSVPGGVMHVWLMDGRMPSVPAEATVLTDEDCEPDAEGISRCRNRILLPSGDAITVRHPHDMTKVPCLEPGERVKLVGA